PGDVSTLTKVRPQRSATTRLITLSWATLASAGPFTHINSGHTLPILARAAGETETLTTKSVLLGAFDFVEYKSRQTRLAPGDVVVMYTDGVTEAANADNQMYGEDRLEKLVMQSVNLSAEEIKQWILDDVLSFTAGLPQGDDITMIVLKMK